MKKTLESLREKKLHGPENSPSESDSDSDSDSESELGPDSDSDFEDVTVSGSAADTVTLDCVAETRVDFQSVELRDLLSDIPLIPQVQSAAPKQKKTQTTATATALTEDDWNMS